MTRMVMSGGLHRRRSLFLWGLGGQMSGDRGQTSEDRRQTSGDRGLMSDCSAENGQKPSFEQVVINVCYQECLLCYI